MSRVEIKKQNKYFIAQLLSNKQLLLRISHDDELQTCLFETIIKYQNIAADAKFIFYDMSEVFQAIRGVVKRGKEEDIAIQSNGKVQITFEFKIYQKLVVKNIIFALEKQVKNDDLIELLRANLQLAQRQINQLKNQVNTISSENKELKDKYNYLQQIVLAQSVNKWQQNLTKNKLQPKQNNIIKNTIEKKVDKKREQQQQIEELSENDLKIIPMKIQFDEKCMYFNKFKIEQGKITSLNEDYYQIYSKQPLPVKGIYKFNVKMVAENHLSIGLLGESALNNQYSFQNSKAICIYSYFYGNFRGIYYRSKYEPLEWSIQQGQTLQFQIDMFKKTLKIKIKSSKSAQLINFKQLYQEEQMYFFIEMYEKDNCIEFVQ